jgi:L-histidine Nalpha-methyltransferase / hercynylcysteine S-oxide synthase
LHRSALRKTSLILDALAESVSTGETPNPFSYYALDLEERELKRTLAELSHSDVGPRLSGKVSLAGMLGEYQDGIRFVEQGGLRGRDALSNPSGSYSTGKRARDESPSSPSSGTSSPSDESAEATSLTAPSTPDHTRGPLHILFLGSSLGNFPRGDDAAFLRSLPLRAGSGDKLLLGLDHDNDARKIELAYNDPQKYTEKFIMNGLRVAGETVGDSKFFDENNWEYVNRYNTDMRAFHMKVDAIGQNLTDQIFRPTRGILSLETCTNAARPRDGQKLRYRGGGAGSS